ncbi:MAG: helix-turn-helix domain-containing protein [Thermoplasmataceae archaeon]|jgi:predicted DNA binding protein
MPRKKSSIDTLIEVSREDCRVTNLVYSKKFKAEVMRLKIGGDVTIHRIICQTDKDKLLEELRKAGISCSEVGKNSIWARSESCSSCAFLSRENIIITGSRSYNRTRLSYRFKAPSMSYVRNLNSRLEEKGFAPLLVEANEETNSDLTEREQEIIEIAFRKGYYDSDRKISMKDLAKELKVSVPSLSDVLRRGTRKIVKDYVENHL